MSSLSFGEAFITQQVDGPALSNTTTPTSLLPGAAKYVVPANFFQIGKQLLVKAGGRISTAAATPGTFTFDIRLGSIVVFNGGASPTVATSRTNDTWDLEVLLTCRSIGSGTGAALLGHGHLLSPALATATPIQLLPPTAPAAGNGFDSVAAQVLDLFGAWSVANASNSIRCDSFSLISLN